MGTSTDTAMIKKIAHQILNPLGMKRERESRVWLDDNGWWVTLIEFQPSTHSEGTYLNVGIHFLWYPKKNSSFDISFRLGDFVQYQSERQFEEDVKKLAEIARTRVLNFRDKLSTTERARSFIISSFEEHRPTIWVNFHRGMACALAKDRLGALEYLNEVVNNTHDAEWAVELRDFTRRLMERLDSSHNALPLIVQAVKDSRELKQLTPGGDQFVRFA